MALCIDAPLLHELLDTETMMTVDKASRVWMLWLKQHSFGMPLLDDLSISHDDYVIADLGDNGKVVGNKYHGQIERRAKLKKEVENVRLNCDIKRCCCFIRDQELRFDRDGCGYGDPLKHSP